MRETQPLHLPFEEMLLGNPNHLHQLQEGEGLQTHQLALLIPRGTSGLVVGSQAKPQPFSCLGFHRAFWNRSSGQSLLPRGSCSTQETGHDSSLGVHPKGVYKGSNGIWMHRVACPAPVSTGAQRVFVSCKGLLGSLPHEVEAPEPSDSKVLILWLLA